NLRHLRFHHGMRLPSLGTAGRGTARWARWVMPEGSAGGWVIVWWAGQGRRWRRSYNWILGAGCWMAEEVTRALLCVRVRRARLRRGTKFTVLKSMMMCLFLDLP